MTAVRNCGLMHVASCSFCKKCFPPNVYLSDLLKKQVVVRFGYPNSVKTIELGCSAT